MIRRALIPALAALGMLSAAPGHALDNITGTSFQLLSDITIDSAARAELLKFRRTKDAYGAFFVSPDGTTSVWYSGLFSQEDADRTARADCGWYAGTPCVRYAILSPTNTSGPVAVPREAQAGMREAIRKNGSGSFAAFAVNAMGGWGSSWNYETPDVAREQALLSCESEAAQSRAEHDRGLRQAFEADGVYHCRVIITMQTQ